MERSTRFIILLVIMAGLGCLLWVEITSANNRGDSSETTPQSRGGGLAEKKEISDATDEPQDMPLEFYENLGRTYWEQLGNRQRIGSGKETLRGLEGGLIIIEELRPEAEVHGLTRQQIKTDVELSLRRNGIRVLTKEEITERQGMPQIYVNVNPVISGRFVAYDISLELRQNVILFRDQTKVVFGATTWREGTTGILNLSNIRDIREEVKGLVDMFSDDFLAVNPAN